MARKTSGNTDVLHCGTAGSELAPNPKRRLSKHHIFGALSIVAGVALCALVVYLLAIIGFEFYEGALYEHPASSLVVYIVNVVLAGIVAIAFIVLGIRLVLGKIRGAHLMAETICLVIVGCAICELMLEGVTVTFGGYLVLAAGLLVAFTIVDPALVDERKLQRKLRDMQTRQDAEAGVLGRDLSGRGLIAIDFVNLFWIFTIGAFTGDVVETVYHYMIEVPGEFQIRAGLLWGPFSPIYGFGAVLLTLVLNRFYHANVVLIFLVSAVLGGAFEYFSSWFLEFAFGSVAWDYSGRFLNIGGRTDFMFMCMWGVLGVVWIRALLPAVLKVVNMIPWQWRYTLTSICAAFIIFDGVMTLLALDCWYMRLAGEPPDQLAFTQFFATHFDNAYMESRFQSMSIHPELTSRV